MLVSMLVSMLETFVDSIIKLTIAMGWKQNLEWFNISNTHSLLCMSDIQIIVNNFFTTYILLHENNMCT